MSQSELLKEVVDKLAALRIDYMATGSIVSSLQGEPRASHDIDLVIALPTLGAHRLAQAFPPPRFYLDESSIREAAETGGMFNLLDTDCGEKVDFWVLTDSPFDESRFLRRRPQQVGDLRLVVSAPEDTILMKLRWAKLSGGSEKQFTDALRVYEVQHSGIDQPYMDRWARLLDVMGLWERLRALAQPI